MREIRINKGNGTFRVVYSPGRGERRRLDAILPVLMAAERKAAVTLDTEAVAHGFVAGRSPVTCALPHAGMAVSVCCDLAGWFDSVRPEQVRAGLALAGADAGLAEKVCHLGAPRQGLPTSPAACNLAAVTLDRWVLDDLRDTLPDRAKFVYTRYADDLTVSLSADEPALIAWAESVLGRSAALMGWSVAHRKTKVQHASAGRRVIVGVSVGDTAGQVQAPRWQRRRLRAARHLGATRPQALGLAEWCAMKLPRALRGVFWRIAVEAPADALAPLAAAALADGFDIADAAARAVWCDLAEERGEDVSVLRATLAADGGESGPCRRSL